MRIKRLALVIGSIALAAQLAYTFIGFHIYFPVLGADMARIVTLFAPNDLALYRAYLPAGVEMPPEPMVKVDFVEVTPSWHEAFVSLRVRYQGETGWYGVTWPIDSLVPYALGYWVGYPKFMTEPMLWQRTATGYTGAVRRDDEALLKLDFVEAERDATPIESTVLDDSATYFNLMPPLRGPQINKLSNVVLSSNDVHDTRGLVHMTVNPGERWARLITDGTERTTPGHLLAQKGHRFGFLIADKVN